MAPFWTPKIVGETLIQAFRLMPNHVVYTVPVSRRLGEWGGGGFMMPDAPATAAEAFSWAPRYLDAHPKLRLYLFTWARCRATGERFSELCVAKGWPRSTADLGRKLAASIVADALNSSC